MIRTLLLACLIAGLGAYVWWQFEEQPAIVAVPLTNPTGEPVAVPGSQIQFLSKARLTIGNREISFTLTGTALRTKYTLKIYGMGSYLEDGATVGSAEELAAAEKVKLLHLVMERKAQGSDFIDAFRTAIGKERANGEFAAGFAKLTAALGSVTAEKGENVTMLYVPGTGTRIRVGDAADVTIPGDCFGLAIWGTYLGPKPIDEDIKKNLVVLIRK